MVDVTRRRALEALGLDVTYERGDGSRLRRSDGTEVWDFLGGYGSTFFGHNHPALLEVATEFLRDRRVVHAQASVRAESEALALALSQRLRASLGGDYEVMLSSTGAEAVEMAARHAEVVRERVRDRLSESLGWGDPSRTDAPGRVALPWSRRAMHILETHGIDGARDDALQLVRRHNAEVLAQPLRPLAVNESYHGVTAGARSLTDARSASTPPGRVTFVDPRDPDAVERVLRGFERTVLRVERRADTVDVTPAPWSPVTALFVEPIQGEGGIRPLPRETMAAWHRALAARDLPVVADEIQSGLGRTGTFLYCQQLGLRPEYVLLGKSLGGALAKISAMAVRRTDFLPGLTLHHVSTFAEDGFSSAVALRALQVLDEERGEIVAAEKGRQLLERLRRLQSRYPDVIAEVRGAGLMIGIEWTKYDFDHSNTLYILEEYGWLGYVLTSALLHRHRIRVAPTLTGRRTIRIEPAYDIPQRAIDDLLVALEDLCQCIRAQDSAGLLSACMRFSPPTDTAVTPRKRILKPPRGPHVGFVGHFIDPRDIKLWDPQLARIRDEDCTAFLDRVEPLVEPILTHRDDVRSASGEVLSLTFIGLAVPSRRFHESLRRRDHRSLQALVARAVERARSEGCSIVGLGGYSSIITRNGRSLSVPGVALTTGNGFTVAAGLTAMRLAAEERGITLGSARAAVVGATGNVGSVLSELLAAEVESLVLVGRPERRHSLEARATRIAQAVLSDAPGSPLGRRLAARGVRLGPGCPVEVATDLAACRDCDLIVAASNQPSSILRAEHLSRGPVVVNDISVPADVHPSVPAKRPLATIIRGGVVRTPANPDWNVPGIPLEPGEMYACMTETVLMGFEGSTEHGSLGSLNAARVRETLRMAEAHGFDTIRSTQMASY